MKICVVTFFNYCNFGAALQCYALSEILKREGHEVEYLDYTCPYIGNPFKISNIRKKGIIGYLYSVAGNIFYIPRHKKFALFREKIAHTAPVSPKNIKDYAEGYDKYITGSDQVWNVKLTDFDKTYFLDFVKDNSKKISYAASFGGKNIKEDRKNDYAKLFREFEAISVRESYGKDIVKKLSGKEATVTIDPTLLLKKDDWKKVSAQERVENKPYILVYQLGFSKDVIGTVRRVKKEKKMKVIYIPFPLGGVIKAKCKLSLGPAEWLALFRDAEYIVTDSYHGVVFSLLFEKKFLVVADGQHKNQRVISLLHRLGLEDRIVGKKMNSISADIDYEDVRKNMQVDREQSIQWLRKNLQ